MMALQTMLHSVPFTEETRPPISYAVRECIHKSEICQAWIQSLRHARASRSMAVCC